MEVFQLSLEKK